MRLLLIHSDYIEYEAQKKTKMAEADPVPKDGMTEALTVFTAVEAVDEEDIDDVVAQSVAEIEKTATQLAVKNLLIYPYAHLSSDLSSPEAAVAALSAIERRLNETGRYEVKRAPFGWYKKFKLSCKGHPLSELSKTIVPGAGAAVKEKKEVTHEFFVMTPDGERHETGEFLEGRFGALVKKEIGIAEPVGGEPIHVDLMRSKELVDYEPASDVGNLRWLPRGKIVRDLLADYVLHMVLEYGGSPVETPVMYDLGDKAIYEHADKFGERQYRFKSGNRNMMLRFAACFGMFSIMRDMHISPNTLPIKMYELSTYSFRHEQRGEVIGLKRLRAFTMPDMHSLCLDMEGALHCFEEQLRLGWKSGEDFETELVGVFRCTRGFYEKYENWVKSIVAESRVPMLIEILSDRVHYWIAKVDLAAIDGQGRPIENPTVQIDVESSTRFDIKYHLDGEVVHPPILHCSPTGSIERVICALLENTANQSVPQLPAWLAPTQVRLIPVAERHTSFADELCTRLNKAQIRTDLDDREESVGKKVREAGMDWVPYVIVIGDAEMETGKLTVTIRKLSEPRVPHKEQLDVEELITLVRTSTDGMPFRPLYTTRNLSKKPRYI
ncbi:threonine--tRNA ligase [Methanosphaerula palustris]|uniref:Threonine--tRNA ligase n=1 Tax=Methanosphaerula palustris (strain ATCC BAA-1556 / DSM 19958 / E1-9c) TaxID=521011 RepID=SYT_METPE|nr:threonine--tRNA ligase [Methanosphaerula palustris]B8GHN2.1 RecName: Full=Threonine--tRNA ligase; AltName: Full=Threonyl-tRNA synthetase; Short=ThrRS [Methanosphaerula palustris E1-9c]ACL16637.1 threonyl-tRNA synthetase [Methanosphaerula palustris E1-9c]